MAERLAQSKLVSFPLLMIGLFVFGRIDDLSGVILRTALQLLSPLIGIYQHGERLVLHHLPKLVFNLVLKC